MSIIALTLAYIISGHHSGIPDGGTVSDIYNGTLSARLKKDDLEPYEYYKNDIQIRNYTQEEIDNILELLTTNLSKIDKKLAENQLLDEYAFFVRYCYSCLVDADSLDTEAFCQNKRRTTFSCRRDVV